MDNKSFTNCNEWTNPCNICERESECVSFETECVFGGFARDVSCGNYACAFEYDGSCLLSLGENCGCNPFAHIKVYD